MKKSGLLVVICLTFHVQAAFSQHQEINEHPATWIDDAKAQVDTTSLIGAFVKGSVHGHFRYFFMATDNARGLTDYYANAAGGGIKFETARFHGFQVAVSGFYIFNLASSDLTVPDSSTQQPNRYEIGLFDVTNPDNKSDIDALEELYIKYSYQKSYIRFGKQLLNTPFINLQDGRMRPGVSEGVWMEINNARNIRFEGGWLYAFSPRSTSRWYRSAASIGIYPTGINTDGTKSGYSGNLESNGVLHGGVTFIPVHDLTVQLWDLFAFDLFNSLFFQADKIIPMENGSAFYVGIQGTSQQAIGDGGNPDPSKTYINRDARSYTFGAKTGWKSGKVDVSLNYNRITSDGRYLMPREWGRDPFFTFLPRERNEGFGDVHAGVVKAEYKWPGSHWKTSLAAGYYRMPDVKNYRLSKYGLPSYMQFNADVRYSFGGVLKGLDAQLLVAGKQNQGETYDNNRYVINKVDMVNWNLVLNFRF